MKRFVLGAVAFVAGCYPVGGADLSSQEIAAMGTGEVVSLFVEASRNRDRVTGRQLAGSCWDSVSEWFIKVGPGVEDYRVPDLHGSDRDVDAWIDFGATSGSVQRLWRADLRRDAKGSAWRICRISERRE